MSFRWIPLSRRAVSARRDVAAVPGRARQIRKRFSLELLEDRTLLSSSIPTSASTWTAFGPAPIANGVTPGSQEVSGRVTGIAASSTDPNTIYVSTAGGGVWKTTNGGGNWFPLTDNQPTLFTGAVALAAGNSNIVYAGTGEADNSSDSNYGYGLLASKDGGQTWALENNFGAFTRRTIAKVVVSSADPTGNTVYIAVSSNGTNGQQGNTGIYKSTNGGLTWINTTATISSTAQYSDLVQDPNTPNTLYAAIGTPNGSTVNGVYATTNAGQTWTLVSGISSGVADGRISLAVSGAGGTTSIAASIAGSGQTGTTLGGLYKVFLSSNAGVNWTDLTATASVPNYFGGNQGFYDNAIAIDPNNPANIFLGGSSAGGAPGLIESANSGASWTNITTDVNGNGPAAGAIRFAFDAAGDLLDATTGGLFRLDNSTFGSILWSDLNGDLQITQFNGIGINPTNADIAYGGTTDNGVLKFSDSSLWTQVLSANGGMVAVNPSNPFVVYQVLAYGTGAGFFQVSSNAGQTWTPSTTGINVTGPTPDAANMYPPLTLDPSNGNRLLLGTNRIYESTNQGANWTAISTPGLNGWLSGPTVTINSIAISATNPNTVYASTSDGRIYSTTNDGASWTVHLIPGVFDNSLTGLYVSPTNSSQVFVVRDTFTNGAGHLYSSSDGGVTWTALNGNMPDIPTWSFAMDSPQPGITRYFLGTDQGVWTSSDNGNTWSQFQGGLPNAQVLSLQLVPGLDVLAAGTHGRGLFEITEINPIQLTATAPSGAAAGIALSNVVVATFKDGTLTDPTGMSASIDWGEGQAPTIGTVTYNSGIGAFQVTGSYTYSHQGTFVVAVTVTDGSGNSSQSSSDISVDFAPLSPDNGFTIAPTEGKSFTGVIGSFTDVNTAAQSTDFIASIDWGDGSNGLPDITTGIVSANPAVLGEFDVTGTHVYHSPGSFSVTISITYVGVTVPPPVAINGSAIVADAPLHATGLTLGSTEGSTFNNVVASFNDENTQGVAGEYLATIDWGDGSLAIPDITTGVVKASNAVPGAFNVSGSHVYIEQGTYTITVTIVDMSNGRSPTDPTDSRTTATSTIVVKDAPLSSTGTTLTGVEGVPLVPASQPNPVIATFSDANTNAGAADYAPVVITWGDGATSTGTIAKIGKGLFTVSGNHTYETFGTYTITAQIINDSGGRSPTDPTDSTVTAFSSITVADAPLSSSGTTLSAMAGQPLTAVGGGLPVIALFTSLNPTEPVSDFSATVDWGDGTTANPDITVAQVIQPGGTGTPFEVVGTNTYQQAGSFKVKVSILDIGGSTATATSTVNIADAPLTGAFVSSPPTLTEGQAFTGTIATFSDANILGQASDFIVTIDWGDNSQTQGTVIPLGSGEFNVTGVHTYSMYGNYNVNVQVIDVGGSRVSMAGTLVVNDSPIVPASVSVSTVEGTVFNGQIATFSASPTAPVSSFTAIVDWGDGDPTTTGIVTATGNGQYSVAGTHTYLTDGLFEITVSLSDLGGESASIQSAASVADAPITSVGTSITPVRATAFSGVVATFIDGNTAAPASDFNTQIVWGDGAITDGTVVALGAGGFEVLGTHTYTATGAFSIAVTIDSIGGSTSSADSSANVLLPLTGVLTSAPLTTVTVPTFSGTGETGTTVNVYAFSTAAPGTPIALGQAGVTASGTWSLAGPSLPDGHYFVIASMVSSSGATIQTLAIVPSSSPFIIDTTGPTIVSTSFAPKLHQVLVTFQDNGSGMNPATLLNASNYVLSLPGKKAGNFSVTGVSLLPGVLGSGQITAVVSYNLGRKITAGNYVLTVHAPGLTDLAGNVTIAKDFVTFPQTNNSPNPDYVAQFTVNPRGVASAPVEYIPPAERRAAARYAIRIRKR